jgi:hypothetical protein
MISDIEVDQLAVDIKYKGIDTVDQAVADIRAMADSDDHSIFAHEEEDKLHSATLSAISSGAADPALLAAAALQTAVIDFPRYFW